MTDKEGKYDISLTYPEYDYYQMWIFLNRLGIKPYELDLISVEDKNVLWKMLLYQDTISKHDSFMENSRNVSKKNK